MRAMSWLTLAAFGCNAAAGLDDVRIEDAVASASSEAPPPAPPPAPDEPTRDEPTISISAIGDCTLGSFNRTFDRALEEQDGDLGYFFSGVADVLSSDDLTIANLETPLTRQPRRRDVRAAFRGKPEYAGILVRGSVEAVNLANNHYNDCGALGAQETVRALDAHGVASFGWERVFRRTIAGIDVVSLGFEGGHLGDLRKITRTVRELKRPDNLVIVSYHWGGEGSSHPTPVQYALGRATIDAGADLVLGHHPHVLQGIERYRGRPIVYSLGNFVFGGDSHPDDMDAMIYQARFRLREGRVALADEQIIAVSISSHPEQNDYRPRLLEGADAERVQERIRSLSDGLWSPRAGPSAP